MIPWRISMAQDPVTKPSMRGPSKRGAGAFFDSKVTQVPHGPKRHGSGSKVVSSWGFHGDLMGIYVDLWNDILCYGDV